MARPSVELHEVEIERETDNAMLITLPDSREVWLPLSQVDEIHRQPAPSKLARLVVTQWIAKKEDLC